MWDLSVVKLDYKSKLANYRSNDQFSNDLRKDGTSIKLQLSIMTCINSGIVPGLFLNTLFFRYGKTK
jgi:hypothetical protein